VFLFVDYCHYLHIALQHNFSPTYRDVHASSHSDEAAKQASDTTKEYDPQKTDYIFTPFDPFDWAHLNDNDEI